MDNEIWWRQNYRVQLEISLGMARSLMASHEPNTKVYVMAYHLKEKTQKQIDMHDEYYPYDISEVK